MSEEMGPTVHRNQSLAIEPVTSNTVRKAVSHFHKLEKLRQVGSRKEVAARRRQKVEKSVVHACENLPYNGPLDGQNRNFGNTLRRISRTFYGTRKRH